MTTLIQFVARIETTFYILAAIGIFFSIRGLAKARQARRLAVFGLEREAAQLMQTRSISTIVGLLLMCGAIYIIANIVEPNMAELPIEPTPTSVVFVTQQPTATQPLLIYPTITSTVGLPPAAIAGTSSPTPGQTVNGCEISGATITSPIPGQTVTGQVAVQGQANILNFSQYKFEITGPSTNGAWVVVANFTTPIIDGFLGTWDSTSLMPGNYTLRLVVSRVDGSFPTPCEVPIIIAGPGSAPVMNVP